MHTAAMLRLFHWFYVHFLLCATHIEYTATAKYNHLLIFHLHLSAHSSEKYKHTTAFLTLINLMCVPVHNLPAYIHTRAYHKYTETPIYRKRLQKICLIFGHLQNPFFAK